MAKYYVLLFLIVGLALYYVYLEEPCHKLSRTDFSNKHPSYKILNSGAKEGSPESVQCHISYQKPDSEQTHEEVWVYESTGSGWKFSRVLETAARAQTP